VGRGAWCVMQQQLATATHETTHDARESWSRDTGECGGAGINISGATSGATEPGARSQETTSS
jgi:hypothetical protein